MNPWTINSALRHHAQRWRAEWRELQAPGLPRPLRWLMQLALLVQAAGAVGLPLLLVALPLAYNFGRLDEWLMAFAVLALAEMIALVPVPLLNSWRQAAATLPLLALYGLLMPRLGRVMGNDMAFYEGSVSWARSHDWPGLALATVFALLVAVWLRWFLAAARNTEPRFNRWRAIELGVVAAIFLAPWLINILALVTFIGGPAVFMLQVLIVVGGLRAIRVVAAGPRRADPRSYRPALADFLASPVLATLRAQHLDADSASVALQGTFADTGAPLPGDLLAFFATQPGATAPPAQPAQPAGVVVTLGALHWEQIKLNRRRVIVPLVVVTAQATTADGGYTITAATYRLSQFWGGWRATRLEAL